MCKPKVKQHEVKPYVPPAPPAPAEKPAEIKINTKSKSSSQQSKKRKGKSKFRTDLGIKSGTTGTSGLKIPTS